MNQKKRNLQGVLRNQFWNRQNIIWFHSLSPTIMLREKKNEKTFQHCKREWNKYQENKRRKQGWLPLLYTCILFKFHSSSKKKENKRRKQQKKSKVGFPYLVLQHSINIFLQSNFSRVLQWQHQDCYSNAKKLENKLHGIRNSTKTKIETWIKLFTTEN